jgi:hypothetical protein
MMKSRTLIRSTALLLTLLSLFVSSIMMIEAGGHTLGHGHTANHASQHASFICTWMCAASTFADSEDQSLSQNVHPTFETIPISTERFFNNLSILSFHIRPPPISFS